MHLSLRPLGRSILAGGLRLMPWLVAIGAVAAGAWFLRGIAPIADGGQLAAVGVGLIAGRAVAALAAITAGAFALSSGLAGLWFHEERAPAQRFRGLAALGAASVTLGGLVMVGPLIGFDAARSIAGLAATGLFAAATVWSTWAIQRRTQRQAAPREIEATIAADTWLEHDPGVARSGSTSPSCSRCSRSPTTSDPRSC